METSKFFLFLILFTTGFYLAKFDQLMDFNSTSLPNHGICHSIDIRNHPRNFEKLRNCSVIVGFLQVVLIEMNANLSQYVFPYLKEITQFMLFYRVSNLQSLGHMFPNLTLIRGHNLLGNYALVIYEMPNLQEIGLKYLRKIQRGTVRIDSNPQLCLTDTINWEAITGKSHGNHILDNGHSACPSFDVCRGCDTYCWSSKACQKFSSDMCSPDCLEGCTQRGLCFRCKNYSNDGVCVSECPPDKYIVTEAMECVTKELCSKLFRGSGWIFENQCIENCPVGYNLVMSGGTKNCKICDDKCNKTCDGMDIASLNDAQYYKGCHYVNGSLNIKILGQITDEDDVIEELEKNLGDIIEIRGYLRVVRSSIITSLSFLKKLTIIHGEELWNDRYAFVVHDMSNLQTLLDWEPDRSFSIVKGTLFFNQNAKLCMKEIRKLTNKTGVIVKEHDVCRTSNGYKQFCHRTKLVIQVDRVEKRYVIVTWQRFRRTVSDMDRSGEAVGYLVHYIQSDEDNMTTYHGIDSCNRKGWKVEFVSEPQDPESNTVTYNITKLNPYTTYAFYIQTYNEAKDHQNSASEDGESDVQYFRTKMNRPPMPMYLEAVSNSHDSLTLYWSLSQYNGIIAQYNVEIHILQDNQSFFDTRNYCLQDIDRREVYSVPKYNQEYSNSRDDEENCKCRDDKFQLEKNALVENKDIDCDEQLDYSEVGTYNQFLQDRRCGRIDFFNHERFTRDAKNNFNIHETLDLEPNSNKPVVHNRYDANQKYDAFSTQFPGEYKNFTIDNLKHFGKYLIFLAGCSEDDGTYCGMAAITTQRTLANPSADNMNKINLEIVNSSLVKIEWEEPSDPNGALLNYILQYKRRDLEHSGLIEKCIPRLEHEKNGNKYYIWNLNPGIYSVRVKANSLGNEGVYSEWIEFMISEKASTIVVLCILSVCLITALGVVYFMHLQNEGRHDDTDSLVTPESFRSTMGVRYETEGTNERVHFYHSY